MDMDKKDCLNTPCPSSHKRRKKSVEFIEIDGDLCKGCNICIEFCPTGVFQESGKLSKRGYYLPIIADIEKCPGCMLCELLCPELAIIIAYAQEPDDAEMT